MCVIQCSYILSDTHTHTHTHLIGQTTPSCWASENLRRKPVVQRAHSNRLCYYFPHKNALYNPRYKTWPQRLRIIISVLSNWLTGPLSQGFKQDMRTISKSELLKGLKTYFLDLLTRAPNFLPNLWRFLSLVIGHLDFHKPIVNHHHYMLEIPFN